MIPLSLGFDSFSGRARARERYSIYIFKYSSRTLDVRVLQYTIIEDDGGASIEQDAGHMYVYTCV